MPGPESVYRAKGARRVPSPGGLRRPWPRGEDYSDLIENTANAYGRSWAITRRYAIALDNGCLSPATPAHSTPNTDTNGANCPDVR